MSQHLFLTVLTPLLGFLFVLEQNVISVKILHHHYYHFQSAVHAPRSFTHAFLWAWASSFPHSPPIPGKHLHTQLLTYLFILLPMTFNKNLLGMMRQTGRLPDVGATRSPVTLGKLLSPQSTSELSVKDFLNSCMSSPLHIFSSSAFPSQR